MILINLLPPELKRKERSKLLLPEIPVKKTLLWTTAGLVGIQTLLSVLALGISLRAIGMKHEIVSLTKDTLETRKMKSETLAAQNRLKDIRQLTTKKFYWATILNALTQSVTKGVWLRSLSVEETFAQAPKKAAAPDRKTTPARKQNAPAQKVTSLRLAGSVYAAGQETAYVGKFVKALKDNEALKELFSAIELSDTNQRKIGEYDVFDFVLLCKFRKDKI